MQDEYGALLKNQAWYLVTKNKGTNIIDFKWVYKKLRGNQMVPLIDIKLD
jgi:hypothetical protein